jgi:membrane protease YdiL (CAAX protease family)
MKTTEAKFSRTWWVLLTGPILFLAGILVMSVYYGVVSQGQNVDAIPTLVANSTPYQLVVIQLLLLWVVYRTIKKEGLSWGSIGLQLAAGQSFWREVVIGVVPGVVLAWVYLTFLSPMMASLQNIWDYVPAGELFSALGSALVPFAIANVLLAPYVEEVIYRGYGFSKLLGKFSQPVAIGLSCFFFGLLHWTGGFWYILLTGIVAGGLFVWLRVTRKNLIAPIAAHFALNLIETLAIVLMAK